MSNSENDQRYPEQPEQGAGDARQPLEEQDAQQPRRPSRRRKNGEQDGNAQAGAYSSPDEGAYFDPAGSQDSAEAAEMRYSGEEQYPTPRMRSSSAHRRDERWPATPEQPDAGTEPHSPNEIPHKQATESDWDIRSQPEIEGTVQPIYQPGGRLQPMAPARRKLISNILAGSIIGTMLFLLLGGLVGWQIGKQNAASQNTVPIGYKNGAMTPEQIIAQDRQAVVQINVKTTQGASVGSGVIIDPQGHIITNDHVVAGGQKFNVVLFDGTSVPASLVGADTADDLAVVKINPPDKMYVMPVGDSSRLEVGNTVLAIGNPLGITQTVTQGIVSALGRTVSEGRGGGTILDAVQTDAPINPGNSGGALVDLNGNLIGIPTLVAIDPEFKTPANGVGFAIPSNRVKFIAPQLIQYGKVLHSGRAALQASVITVDPLVAARDRLQVDHGALVVSTMPGGAAANAGLKAGDAIIQVNNRTINNVSDLSDSLLSHDPGSTVSVNYIRGTQQQQARVKLGELKFS